MSIQKTSQIVFGLILAALVSGIEYTFWTTDYDATHDVIVASGPVTNKFATEEYSCGSKKRYMCVDYYLDVNGSRVNVNRNVFLTNSVGDNVTLTRTYKTRDSSAGFDLLISFLHFVICALIVTLTLVYIGARIIWLLTASDDMSFKDFTNRS